jgi:type III secretion system YopN/LcrE/InvE/MxiC family regulator
MSGAIETLRQNIAALNVTSPIGAEIAKDIRGDYRGEGVKTSSEASKLQDAAEELGMSVAHRADKRTLDRREVRQGQGASLEALARIADYYDKLPNMPREAELRTLVETLQSFQEIVENSGGGGQGGVTKDDILAALQRFDPDVTHQYAALDIAREFFTAAGAGDDFHTILDEAYAEFGKGDLAREVKAGFAAAEPASKAAATLETDPAAVREAYRALLRESRNMGQLFEAFRGFDVMKNFGAVIETFMAAAGRDLASTGPSTDQTYLHALVTELARLKKMQTVVDMSSELMRSTDRLLAPGERPRGDAADLAGSVLAFASNPTAGLKEARGMLGRYEQCSLATQVSFANGLRVLHGELPDDVMPTSQARLQQNSTIMAMLDTLVADEEREYEERENGETAGDAARKAVAH